MTVTYLGEDFEAQEGDNQDGVRTYTRVFKLVASSRSDGPYTVGSNSSLPRIGSRHPEDPMAFCRGTTPSRATNGGYFGWIVTARYDTSIEMSENPLFDRPEIEWDGENYEEVVLYDRQGDAVINSAGDPFENVFRERTIRVVRVARNVAAVPSWVITSEDAVNSSAFVLDGIAIAAGIAKLGAPKLGPWQVRNNIRYRVMTMVFKLKKDGWVLAPLDAGFRRRNGLNELVRCVSDDGTDVTQPVPLDGSGGQLADPTPSTVVFGNFDIYPAYNFNLLPLT